MAKQFEVSHYGTLVHTNEFERNGNIITFKVYEFEGELYTEIWSNGILLSFDMVI